MKSLLLKDWYVTWKYCKLHLGVILLMSLLSLFRDVGMMYLTYVMLFAGMLPTYTLSVDEKWEWNRYAQALPYDRRDIVTGKYIYAALVLGGTGLLLLVLWGGRALIGGEDLGAILSSLCVLLSFALIFPTTTLPFMYRFGVEKGRFITLTLVALLVGVVMATEVVELDGVSTGTFAAASGIAAPLVLLGMLALFFLSWLLAVKLYAKREL